MLTSCYHIDFSFDLNWYNESSVNHMQYMYILYVLYLYEDKTFKKSIDERVRYFVDI